MSGFPKISGVTNKKCPVSGKSCGRKQLVDERLKENGKNSASYQTGHKQANNGTVQQWCAEQHLGMHNSSVLVTDGLLQQTTTPGSTAIS
jgi:hypothetical protein